MITDRQIQQLRAIQLAAMPSTATITTWTLTKNAMGEDVRAAVSTTSPCRVLVSGTASPREAEVLVGLDATQTWILEFPLTVNVPETAEIAVNGDTYSVIKTVKGQSYETVQRVACTKR